MKARTRMSMLVIAAYVCACSDANGETARNTTGLSDRGGAGGTAAADMSAVTEAGRGGSPGRTQAGQAGVSDTCELLVRPMSGEGVVLRPTTTPGVQARVATLDGKLLALDHVGAGSGVDPVGPAALQIYDPVTDRWTRGAGAETPPVELGSMPTSLGFYGDRYLIAGGGNVGTQRLALFAPLSGEWQLLAAASAPAFLTAAGDEFGFPAAEAPQLLVRSDPLAYRPAENEFTATTFREFTREWNVAIAGSRLLAFGGRTARCNAAPNCMPLGYRDGNMALPIMPQDVHGGGELHDFATGAVVELPTDGAPSPRYDAYTSTLGHYVLIFGGLNNPHWGFGAGPDADFALNDGALYDLQAQRWSPFTAPDGLKLRAAKSFVDEPGSARLVFASWLGSRALLGIAISDSGGAITILHKLYDPSSDRYTDVELPEGRVLRTRSGNLVVLGATSITRVDAEDGSRETIPLTPPVMPEHDGMPNSVLLGPLVQAWDGCRLYMFGYARLRYAMPQQGICPPGFGCDPPSLMVREVIRLNEGTLFQIGD